MSEKFPERGNKLLESLEAYQSALQGGGEGGRHRHCCKGNNSEKEHKNFLHTKKVSDRKLH